MAVAEQALDVDVTGEVHHLFAGPAGIEAPGDRLVGRMSCQRMVATLARSGRPMATAFAAARSRAFSKACFSFSPETLKIRPPSTGRGRLSMMAWALRVRSRSLPRPFFASGSQMVPFWRS